MKNHFLIFVFAMFCVVCVSPAMATDNPYKNAGMVTAVDVPVTIVSDTVPMTDTSVVMLDGANYQHTIGRVSIFMKPLMEGLNEKISTEGNMRLTGDSNIVKYEFYKDLIKEHVILTSPETVRYSYDIELSDWVTIEPDFSRPEISRDAGGNESVSFPYTKEVTNYALDSTTDVNTDPWGNVVFYVNGAGVAVLPKPFAIDATGKRFDLDFALDKATKTISVTGDMPGAQYPVVVDPSERVTNGGFETGTADGWTPVGSPPPTLTITSSGGAYEGTYYCLYQGNGPYWGFEAYSMMYQNIDYTGVTSVSAAAKIFGYNQYDFVVSDTWWQGYEDGTRNYGINFPGQVATGWVVKSATPTLSGIHPLDVWTYEYNTAGFDSISAAGTPVTPTPTPTPTPALHFIAGPVGEYHLNQGYQADQPRLNSEYTVFINVKNPNGISLPLSLTMDEIPVNEGFEEKYKPPYYPPKTDTKTIGASDTESFEFKFRHHWSWMEGLKQKYTIILEPGLKKIDNIGMVVEFVNELNKAQEVDPRFITYSEWTAKFSKYLGYAFIGERLISAGLGQHSAEYNYRPQAKNVDGLTIKSVIISVGYLKVTDFGMALTTGHLAGWTTVTGAAAFETVYGAAALFIAQASLVGTTSIFDQMAYDPDQNYMDPINVAPETMPELDQIPQSPLKDFARQTVPLVPHSTALMQTYSKYLGAEEVNDEIWETKLLKDCYKYSSLLKDDFNSLNATAGPAIEYLEKQEFNPSADDISEVKINLQINGIPDVEVQILKRWGFTDQEINSARNLSILIPDSAVIHYKDSLYYLIATSEQQITQLNGLFATELSSDAPPYANFTASTTTGKAPLSVQFTDVSLRSPDQWLWDFGDGETATTQNAEHTYTISGTYTVELTATNSGTGSDTRTKYDYITVTENPVALIDQLIQYINSQNINNAAKKIYISQLNRVKTSLVTDKPGDAIIQLKAFQLTVKIAQGKVLTPEQGSTIQDSVTAIIAAINVPVNQQAIDMTKALKVYVKDLGLPKLTQGVLVLELEGAQLNLEAGKDKEALNHFTIFIKTVQSQDGKAIPHDKALQLIAKAQDIVNVIQQ